MATTIITNKFFMSIFVASLSPASTVSEPSSLTLSSAVASPCSGSAFFSFFFFLKMASLLCIGP